MFWTLVFGIISIVFLSGLAAGMFLGYRAGVHEVVRTNDASYRQKQEVDTKNYEERSRVDTENYKQRIAVVVAAGKDERALVLGSLGNLAMDKPPA